jgi:hypothetical protein
MPTVAAMIAPEPDGVEFFCDAENCCKNGIMMAAANTNRDIQSSEPALATARQAQLLAIPR